MIGASVTPRRRALLAAAPLAVLLAGCAGLLGEFMRPPPGGWSLDVPHQPARIRTLDRSQLDFLPLASETLVVQHEPSCTVAVSTDGRSPGAVYQDLVMDPVPRVVLHDGVGSREEPARTEWRGGTGSTPATTTIRYQWPRGRGDWLVCQGGGTTDEQTDCVRALCNTVQRR
jgi:hypothetical protein